MTGGGHEFSNAKRNVVLGQALKLEKHNINMADVLDILPKCAESSGGLNGVRLEGIRQIKPTNTHDDS